jgi:hypothetical protein
MGEAAEELESLFGRFDASKLFEGGAGAKGSFSGGSQDDDMGIVVMAGAVDLMREGLQEAPGEGVALRVVEFDGHNAVMSFGLYVAVLDFSEHSDLIVLGSGR